MPSAASYPPVTYKTDAHPASNFAKRNVSTLAYGRGQHVLCRVGGRNRDGGYPRRGPGPGARIRGDGQLRVPARAGPVAAPDQLRQELVVLRAGLPGRAELADASREDDAKETRDWLRGGEAARGGRAVPSARRRGLQVTGAGKPLLRARPTRRDGADRAG